MRSERNMDGEKIVKCGCGLPMRQKDWSDHWRACRVGSSVPVTEEDKQALLAYEDRRRQQDEEHEKWLQQNVSSRGLRGDGMVGNR